MDELDPGCESLERRAAGAFGLERYPLTFLAQFLLVLFQVKTVNLAPLSGRAQVDSNYKRWQRFFRGFAVARR